MVDNSCMLWQENRGKFGSCLLYDITKLRHTIFGTSSAVSIAAFVVYITGFILIRRRYHDTSNNEIMDRHLGSTEAEESTAFVSRRTENVEKVDKII